MNFHEWVWETAGKTGPSLDQSLQLPPWDSFSTGSSMGAAYPEHLRPGARVEMAAPCQVPPSLPTCFIPTTRVLICRCVDSGFMAKLPGTPTSPNNFLVHPSGLGLHTPAVQSNGRTDSSPGSVLRALWAGIPDLMYLEYDLE